MPENLRRSGTSSRGSRRSPVLQQREMLGADARRSGRQFRDTAHPLVSLRSPLPLMVAGIGVTLLVIAAVTLPPRPAPEPTQTANLSDAEALTIVAHEMRSTAAAEHVMTDGQTR